MKILAAQRIFLKKNDGSIRNINLIREDQRVEHEVTGISQGATALGSFQKFLKNF